MSKPKKSKTATTAALATPGSTNVAATATKTANPAAGTSAAVNGAATQGGGITPGGSSLEVIAEAAPSTSGANPDAKQANEPWIEIARDSDGYHWQLWSGNGRPMACNAVTYKSLKAALQAVKAMIPLWALVNVIGTADTTLATTGQAVAADIPVQDDGSATDGTAGTTSTEGTTATGGNTTAK